MTKVSRKAEDVIVLPWKELEKMLQGAEVIEKTQTIKELTLIKPRQIKIQLAWPIKGEKL